MSNLKQARNEAATIIQSALDKRIEELKQTDAFKELKAEIQHFETNGNPDSMYADYDSLVHSQRLYVPRALCDDGDVELIEALLKECSDIVTFELDSGPRRYFEWVMELSCGEPVIYDESPERGCYAIFSNELGLKVDRVINETHGYLLIETAMRKHEFYPDVVSCDRYGIASYHSIPESIGNAPDSELKQMLNDLETNREEE